MKQMQFDQPVFENYVTHPTSGEKLWQLQVHFHTKTHKDIDLCKLFKRWKVYISSRPTCQHCIHYLTHCWSEKIRVSGQFLKNNFHLLENVEHPLSSALKVLFWVSSSYSSSASTGCFHLPCLLGGFVNDLLNVFLGMNFFSCFLNRLVIFYHIKGFMQWCFIIGHVIFCAQICGIFLKIFMKQPS